MGLSEPHACCQQQLSAYASLLVLLSSLEAITDDLDQQMIRTHSITQLLRLDLQQLTVTCPPQPLIESGPPGEVGIPSSRVDLPAAGEGLKLPIRRNDIANVQTQCRRGNH